MADQGAIGRVREILVNSTELRASWHYNKLSDRGERWGYSGIASERDLYKNSAAMRLEQHHSVWGYQFWHQTAPAAVIKPSFEKWTRGIRSSVMQGYGSPRKMLREDGYIQGTVKDSTVAVPNALVLLLWRDPIMQVAWTRTNASGVYRFDYLDTTMTAMYCCVHFDPAGGTQWNAARLDWLTPTAY